MPPKMTKCSICGNDVMKSQTYHVGDGKRACKHHEGVVNTAESMKNDSVAKLKSSILNNARIEQLKTDYEVYGKFNMQAAVSAHLELLATFKPHDFCELCETSVQPSIITEHISSRLTVMAMIMDHVPLNALEEDPKLAKRYRDEAMKKYLERIDYKYSIPIQEIAAKNNITEEGIAELQEMLTHEIYFLCSRCVSDFVKKYGVNPTT